MLTLFSHRERIIPMTNENKITEIASLWLKDFSAAVRDRDYDRGRQLFAPNVFAFGTYSSALEGLEALEVDQWHHIWSKTRNFIFHVEDMTSGGNDSLIWIAVLWQSQGQASDGGWFDRHGRASFVLEYREDNWLAIHSHHSLNPTPNSASPAGNNL